MKQLSDFKPLASVVLPDLGELRCAGLTVLVGPNSSGKSHLLQDIFHGLAGRVRKLVVADRVRIDKPPYEEFMRCLEDEGYFSTVEDAAGTKQLRPHTMYVGSGEALAQIEGRQAEEWHRKFAPDSGSPRRQTEFLNYFGRLLVTALFLDRRLISLNSTGVIDFVNQPPQHDLHALYLDDDARALLLEEMISSFGRAVWPDMSRGNAMSLKVSDEGILPTAEDRLSHKRMEAFRSIETEGDGMKSYVATCVALLLGRRPVCLIDEPELCLHPPQAYNLGRFVGRFGTSEDTATFIATHSSHLLRGIIQTAPRVQIVRLTRRNQRFSAHLVPASDLEVALSRPTLRAESVLDGIFAQAVVVVEAEGDRLVYQAAWETIHPARRLDIHFATVGGTGGIADTCSLYRTLQIPIAVIADLDTLIDDERIARILQNLVVDKVQLRGLLGRCKEMSRSMRALPPQVSPEEVVNELRGISDGRMDWSAGDDVGIRQRLSRMSNAIDRMRRLKHGGIMAFPDDIATGMGVLLHDLCGAGLFLVPVGELEEWLHEHDVKAPRSNKRLWANAAAQRIYEVGSQPNDVWQFMASVGGFLTRRP